MINAVTSGTAASGTTGVQDKSVLSKDNFLSLLITQLKNQDPMNPTDSTEFVAQLSQLTLVEQAYATNKNLGSLLSAQSSMADQSALALMGRTVSATGDQVMLPATGSATLGVSFQAKADKVLIQIRDAAGKEVRRLSAGPAPAGASSVAWDGRDASGRQLPAGLYSYSVSGLDGTGASLTGTGLTSGRVTAVDLEGSLPVLTVGGVPVPLSSIQSVTLPEA
jgi:flagellar basal-body rod modification protein FlgD